MSKTNRTSSSRSKKRDHDDVRSSSSSSDEDDRVQQSRLIKQAREDDRQKKKRRAMELGDDLEARKLAAENAALQACLSPERTKQLESTLANVMSQLQNGDLSSFGIDPTLLTSASTSGAPTSRPSGGGTRTIPFPEKKSEYTTKKFRSDTGMLGDEHKSQWLKTRSVARKAITVAGLNLKMTWLQHKKGDLQVAINYLVEEVPQVACFQEHWGAEWLLVETFNHLRGHQNFISKPDDDKKKRRKREKKSKTNGSQHSEDEAAENADKETDEDTDNAPLEREKDQDGEEGAEDDVTRVQSPTPKPKSKPRPKPRPKPISDDDEEPADRTSQPPPTPKSRVEDTRGNDSNDSSPTSGRRETVVTSSPTKEAAAPASRNDRSAPSPSQWHQAPGVPVRPNNLRGPPEQSGDVHVAPRPATDTRAIAAAAAAAVPRIRRPRNRSRGRRERGKVRGRGKARQMSSRNPSLNPARMAHTGLGLSPIVSPRSPLPVPAKEKRKPGRKAANQTESATSALNPADSPSRMLTRRSKKDAAAAATTTTLWQTVARKASLPPAFERTEKPADAKGKGKAVAAGDDDDDDDSSSGSSAGLYSSSGAALGSESESESGDSSDAETTRVTRVPNQTRDQSNPDRSTPTYARGAIKGYADILGVLDALGADLIHMMWLRQQTWGFDPSNPSPNFVPSLGYLTWDCQNDSRPETDPSLIKRGDYDNNYICFLQITIVNMFWQYEMQFNLGFNSTTNIYTNKTPSNNLTKIDPMFNFWLQPTIWKHHGDDMRISRTMWTWDWGHRNNVNVTWAEALTSTDLPVNKVTLPINISPIPPSVIKLTSVHNTEESHGVVCCWLCLLVGIFAALTDSEDGMQAHSPCISRFTKDMRGSLQSSAKIPTVHKPSRNPYPTLTAKFT
ncbi:hypothetical protein RhiJN_12683 [Ceratobasidium sp. AG-Ba]|nr:hypothetical protein RhiJN_12683 [Ceratobasidium sp. AG-Ba]